MAPMDWGLICSCLASSLPVAGPSRSSRDRQVDSGMVQFAGGLPLAQATHEQAEAGAQVRHQLLDAGVARHTFRSTLSVWLTTCSGHQLGARPLEALAVHELELPARGLAIVLLLSVARLGRLGAGQVDQERHHHQCGDAEDGGDAERHIEAVDEVRSGFLYRP